MAAVPVELTYPAPPTPPASPPVPPEAAPAPLDLRALAAVGLADRVAVQRLADGTLEAFDQTLRIIGGSPPPPAMLAEPPADLAARAQRLPLDSDLRKLYVFAEILGGYDTVNELTRGEAPFRSLVAGVRPGSEQRRLTAYEVHRLEAYYAQLQRAIESARDYYRRSGLQGLSVEEQQELSALVFQARARTEAITEVLGRSLIGEIELAVARLYEIRQAIMNVERTVSGIFLVEDAVMFIPANELIELINTVFKGVGNPYLAGNVDGVLLLAARNLIIEIVSFYSYYGKHQIYQLFNHNQTVDRQLVAGRIRFEVRRLLNACRADNKLVLTRIMDREQTRFELSIDAIRREAEREAVEAVIRILPPLQAAPRRRSRGWLRRLAGWLGF